MQGVAVLAAAGIAQKVEVRGDCCRCRCWYGGLLAASSRRPLLASGWQLVAAVWAVRPNAAAPVQRLLCSLLMRIMSSPCHALPSPARACCLQALPKALTAEVLATPEGVTLVEDCMSLHARLVELSLLSKQAEAGGEEPPQVGMEQACVCFCSNACVSVPAPPPAKCCQHCLRPLLPACRMPAWSGLPSTSWRRTTRWCTP